MQNILRKNYKFSIKFKGWINRKLEYQQATVEEILEFQYEANRKDFILSQWVLHFCNKNLKNKLFFGFLWFERKYILKNTENIFNVLKKTYFKGFFDTKVQKDIKASYKPFSSYILLISEKFSCDPNFLLQNYTWEQLHDDEGYVEGLLWNINEQTKEGQEKNKLKGMKHEVGDNEAIRRVQEFLKKQNNKTVDAISKNIS